MRWAGLTAVLLAGLPALSAARDLPKSYVTETQAYSSVDQAAVAALRIAMPLSKSFENGGFIVERDGAFYYSDPVSNGIPGHIAFISAFSKDSRLVAIYHTHPDDGEQTREFSPDDVNESRKLDLNSYIGVLNDGTVRLFEPRKTPTFAYAAPGSPFARERVSDGKVVATILNY